MGATREFSAGRYVVAGVASTVVISLTALTAGLAPAVAAPRHDGPSPTTVSEKPSPAVVADDSAPTTTVPVSEPRTAKTQEPATDAEAPTAAPQPTTSQAPAPVVEAPVVVPTATAAPTPATTAAPPPARTTTTKVAEPTTREPAPTPKVTEAPKPTETPKPTEAPKPTETPKPTEAPKPTETPKAAETPAPRVARTGERPAPVDQVTETPAEGSVTPAAQTPEPETTPPAQTVQAVAPEATPTLTAKPSATETSSTVAKAARPIETLKPQTLDAPEADIEVARNAAPVEERQPEPAAEHDVAALAVSLKVNDRNNNRTDNRIDDRDWNRPDFDHRNDRGDRLDWDRKVRQWRPDWVQYDEYYRPMIFNPYRDPVRVVYMYQNRPRIVQINPLQRVVMYAADLAAYSFTAVVVNALNTAVNVAVGSFFGGGFIPTAGLLRPPPPPPVLRYDNVPVQVRYSQAVYEPFRVQRIVDVGDDSRYGERKVLLDGVTPAWGVWKQSGTGERQFEVHRTQQFPGLDDPREAPLPGDYRMQLVSDTAADTPSGLDRNQVYLIAAAVACSVLSLGAVGLVGLIGRRRGM